MISWYYEKAKDLENKKVINLGMDTRISHVVKKCKLESKKEDEGKVYSDLQLTMTPTLCSENSRCFSYII